MAKRREFTAGSNARVELAALRADRTVQRIAARQSVHRHGLGLWKRRAREGLAGVFERRPAEALRAKIGRPVVERDFL